MRDTLYRVKNIAEGLGLIFIGVLLVIDKEDSYWLLMMFVSLALFVGAIRILVYYFRMARHMVGGKMILYRGIIMLDLGVITLSLTDIPVYYFLMYIIALHLFMGLVDCVRALEARQEKAPSWKWQMIEGALILVLSFICLFGLRSLSRVINIYIYCFGLAAAGVVRIVSACQKNAIVYV